MAILRPRASRIAPREAAAMPLPNEDTTPPVTNTKRVIKIFEGFLSTKESQERLNDGRTSYHNSRFRATLRIAARSTRRAAGVATVNQTAAVGRAGGDLDGLVNPQDTHCKQRCARKDDRQPAALPNWQRRFLPQGLEGATLP